MFSFHVPGIDAQSLMKRMTRITHHPHYEDLNISSVHYDDMTCACTYTYIYKTRPLKNLGVVVPDKIYRKMMCVKNTCHFDFKQNVVRFTITSRKEKYYAVSGRVVFMNTDNTTVVVTLYIEQVVFKDFLKSLPNVILDQVRQYIMNETQKDLQMLCTLCVDRDLDGLKP